jgi:type II secretory pathway component GspD/PulD (secretin)
MKRLTIILTVMFMTFATAVPAADQDTQGKRNPFGSFKKTRTPEPVEVKHEVKNPPHTEIRQPVITSVFSLDFANAAEIGKIISRLVSPNGSVGIDSRLNKIVVSDTASSLDQIRQTISKLDIKSLDPVTTEIFKLNYANAIDIREIVSKLVSDEGVVAVDVKLNSIIVRDTASNIDYIRQAVDSFDIKPQDTIDTEIFNLNFANAVDIEKSISKLVSSVGKVGVNDRLNSIVVKDTLSNIQHIRRIISKLDVKAPQVMIEVLIVNVKLTDKMKMGVDWTKLGTTDNFYSQGLNATGSLNPFGKLSFSSTPGNWNIQGLIDFIQTSQDIRILANPKVLVLNNHTAIIDSVEEIPYRELTETSAGGSIGSVSFKDAGVKLEVTPQITDDGYILMHVMPEQSVQVGTFIVDNSETPIIEKRKTDTTLRVKDGQTIIISGLRKSEPSVVKSKIPILGDIPLIGMLFSSVTTDTVESELGVFITPHIYTNGKLTDDELKHIQQSKKNKSIHQASDLLKLLSVN